MRVSDADDVLRLFDEVCAAIRTALDSLADWRHLGSDGAHAGQYRHDVVADSIALPMLIDAGVGVLSEETGLHGADAKILVIVDPIDGSTNASHGIPWFATSLCAVDSSGPLAATVRNQANGVTYRAVRGRGATRDGEIVGSSAVTSVGDALVALSGLPPRHLGWAQYRSFGAAALDLCAVADGTIDGFIDCSVDAHGVWDFAGALLICDEAGASVADAHGRPLMTRNPNDRRTPVAAGTAPLHHELLAKRALF